MIGIIAQTLWHFIVGWAGIDMLIGFAAVAVAVFETWIINVIPPPFNRLIPDLRKWAIVVAVVAFTCMGLIAHGYKNGLDEKQRQWDAALDREAVTGEKARDDAVRDVGPVGADRGVFRGDKDNRDGDGKPAGGEPESALRRLAPHHLFRR